MSAPSPPEARLRLETWADDPINESKTYTDLAQLRDDVRAVLAELRELQEALREIASIDPYDADQFTVHAIAVRALSSEMRLPATEALAELLIGYPSPPEARQPVFGEREPFKIKAMRANAAFLDEDEAELLEAWDYLFVRFKESQAEIGELQEALRDLLIHIPNGTATDPYKQRAYAVLAASSEEPPA